MIPVMSSLWLLLLLKTLLSDYAHAQGLSTSTSSPARLTSSTSSSSLSTSSSTRPTLPRTTTITHSFFEVSPPEKSRPECEGVKCTWNLWSHYNARGCTPKYTNGSCCPTHFTCPTNLNPEKCHLFGIEFNSGDDIPINGKDDKCPYYCTCYGSHEPGRKAHIACAQDVGLCWNPKPPSPGCRHHRRPCGGCPEEVCDDSIPHICHWNNKTYEEGQYMSFDGEYACDSCICGKNFTGPTGEGCKRYKCGHSGINVRSGCIGLYDEGGCCPFGSVCENDPKILAVPNTSRESSELTCQLGKFTRSVGESLEYEDCRTNCTCITPPEFTCLKSENCLPKISKAEAAQCPWSHSCINGECREDCGDLVEIPEWCSGNGCKCCRHERCAEDTGMCRNHCLDDEYEDTWTGFGCGFVNNFKDPTPKCCVKNTESTTELGPLGRSDPNVDTTRRRIFSSSSSNIKN